MHESLHHYQDAIADSYGPELGHLVEGRPRELNSTRIRHVGPVVRTGTTANVFRCGVCGGSHPGLVLRDPVPNTLPEVTAHVTCPKTGITLDLALPSPVEPTPSSPAV